MDRRKKKMSKALRNETNTNTDALTNEISVRQSNAKLFAYWEKILHDFEDTALRYQLMFYHRILTRQLDFKDKLIEKLQNELNEFKEHRRITAQKHFGLVDNTLSVLKKKIEEIHDEYLVKVRRALPTNLAELEVRTNENDNCWKILKYYGNVAQVQTQEKSSEIKNKYIGYKDLENGRFESIVNTFRRSDLIRYKNMLHSYTYILFEYKKNSEHLMKDYLRLKEKDEYLCALKIKLKTRIERLSNTIGNLKNEIKEPKSQKEINELIKERQELQEGLKKLIKKVADHSKCGEKHLSLLCKITKPIHKEIDNVLKKGKDILKWISFCQKLETPEEKAKLWSTCSTSNSIPLSEPIIVLEIFSNFLNHKSDVKISSKLINDDINKLQHENNELKKKIRCIVQNKKNMNSY